MFVYSSLSKAQLENYTTSGTPNTELEPFFLKPGARNIGVSRLQVSGKGAALTSLSSIVYRVKKWFTTAAAVAGATALVPSPSDPGAQACKATAGIGTAATGVVTAGTGGPTLQAFCGSSASGPGGWVAANVDDYKTLEGTANQSQDLFVASPTASLNYEFQLDHVE